MRRCHHTGRSGRHARQAPSFRSRSSPDGHGGGGVRRRTLSPRPTDPRRMGRSPDTPAPIGRGSLIESASGEVEDRRHGSLLFGDSGQDVGPARGDSTSAVLPRRGDSSQGIHATASPRVQLARRATSSARRSCRWVERLSRRCTRAPIHDDSGPSAGRGMGERSRAGTPESAEAEEAVEEVAKFLEHGPLLG